MKPFVTLLLINPSFLLNDDNGLPRDRSYHFDELRWYRGRKVPVMMKRCQ